MLQKQQKNKQLLRQWKEDIVKRSDDAHVDSVKSDKSSAYNANIHKVRHKKDIQKVQERCRAVEMKKRNQDRSFSVKEYANNHHLGNQYNHVSSRTHDVTCAHKSRAISADERQNNEKMRRKVDAHGSSIPLSGYDLRGGRRAMPTWIQGARL